jgi:hypothetical protein
MATVYATDRTKREKVIKTNPFLEKPSAAVNSPASLLPIGVTPITSRRIATRSCAEKWLEVQAERVENREAGPCVVSNKANPRGRLEP